MHILLWSSAPWVKTGYGNNCNFMLQAFKEAGHEVTIFSIYGLNGGIIDIGGTKVLSNRTNYLWPMGESIKYWETKLKPDLIIQHFDTWTVAPNFIEENDIKTPLVTYTPIDSTPTPYSLKLSCAGSYDNVAMSKFVQRGFHDASMKSSTVIPHGVDRSIYYPESKKNAKAAIGVPEDSFLIGVVGTNKGPRKNIIGQLRAFKQFIWENSLQNEPVFIYLHTYLYNNSENPEGLDLSQIITDYNLDEHVYYTDPDTYTVGFNDNQMRDLYNAFDLLSICSMAEGFGMPIIEAQACGTPVVTTDFSSMPEIVGEGGIKVRIADLLAWQRLGCFHAVPKTEDITLAYRRVYENPKELTAHAIKNAEKYDISIFNSNWVNYIESI